MVQAFIVIFRKIQKPFNLSNLYVLPIYIKFTNCINDLAFLQILFKYCQILKLRNTNFMFSISLKHSFASFKIPIHSFYSSGIHLGIFFIKYQNRYNYFLGHHYLYTPLNRLQYIVFARKRAILDENRAIFRDILMDFRDRGTGNFARFLRKFAAISQGPQNNDTISQ